MNLFNRIISLCDKRGINQSDLEKELGFGKGTISKWKSNPNPSAEKLLLIADYFNVSTDFLLKGNAESGLSEKDKKDITKDLDNTTYETIKKLCKERGIAVTALEKELGFGRGSIGKLRNSQTSAERLQKIADYFNVTVDYLVNGSDNSSLTPKDSRDIAKDLDSIMEKLTAGEDGPASYNGEELSPEATELFRDELKIALKRLKIINKEKYTPKKYKQ